ncbi:MAG TPA: hypothetical protein VMB80_05410 [Candidatus Acidoferrum sp.]|nr:hypothetical protein [Candidatus Acidoferrum sp.]
MKSDDSLRHLRDFELTTELLVLPDGRILVHNLTPPLAELLHELNPDDEQIASRLTPRASGSISHELPN